MERFEARITRMSGHHVGNKHSEGELILSQSEIPLIDEELENLLWQYFMGNFKIPEYYAFTSSSEDPFLNPVFNYVKEIFENEKTFHEQGVQIAKHLFNATTHFQIKEGELFICLIKNLILEDELVDAVGLFKSENKDFFLKTFIGESGLTITYDKGININKLDKGCLIYNTDRSTGFRVQIIDQSSRESEARYWRETFLGLASVSDDFHQTNHYLKLTKDYVSQKMNEDSGLSKADQIGYLNKSMDYFKAHESFDGQEFAEAVFDNSNQIAAFDDYKLAYAEQKNIEILDAFEISDAAVQRNKRVYRSVLKLDKNFHVYIHGDRSKIERGREADGRKYYKIYYNEES